MQVGTRTTSEASIVGSIGMEGGTQGQEHSMGRSTVTESRKVLTHPPHSLSKAGAYGYRL